jgi:tetraprenyl-beta-curcumene synthase
MAFAAAARCYWLEIFPQVRSELARWRRIAEAIPDPALRHDALRTQKTKRGHSEGAAAFAILVPRASRRDFVRLAIAYELMIDYLDTTSERPADDPFANTIHLHRAIKAGFGIEEAGGGYYAFHGHGDDGGYLETHVRACREASVSLRSPMAVSGEIERLVDLYAETQALAHALSFGFDDTGRALNIQREVAGQGWLRREEVLAAAGSSLAVLALLAAATAPLSTSEAQNVSAAYFPWVCALHISLDGLVDLVADRDSGQPSQVDHYGSWGEAAERLGLIAARSRALLADLPRGEHHTTILAGMAGYYLAAPQAWEPGCDAASSRVLRALGPYARVARAVHRLHRAGAQASQAIASAGRVDT